jgi:penicillin G amidase
MKRVISGLLIFVGILFLLIVILTAAGVQLVKRPYPQTSGTISVAGLQAPVEVYRDAYGIPHIYAQNEHDLFFAQGYVHAQDRFWQMEVWRHIGQGRLSEITGAATVDSDKFIRTAGWNRLGQRVLDYHEQETPELMPILEAYSAGVNAYIEANRNSLSINYSILGLVNEPWEIEPWTPLHTVSWGIVMANDLSGNWRSELWRVDLMKKAGEETAALLSPTYPYGQRPVIVPGAATASPTSPAETAAVVDWQRVNTDLVGQLPENGFLGSGAFAGSNNWVVSGAHTTSGKPLLADDPHLGIQMPSIWYQVGLHAPGWEVVGFSFAGVPGVIVGHNGRIAWGVTNVGHDTQDLYIIRVNPDNPWQYEYQGEWQDMDIIEEVIKVNGGEEIVLPVRVTRFGPIINEVVEAARDGEDLLAFRWTAQDQPRLFRSVLMLNQAQDYEEFREALRYWDTPAQNFVYADIEGNIAYQMPGLVPIRRNGDGLLPVPGWTDAYEWTGWIPYEELPALFNPAQGYIVTANNAVVDGSYPYFLNHYWADGDRAQRIEEMLTAVINSGGKLQREDFGRIHNDNYSLVAASYTPLLATLRSDNAQVQAALNQFQSWDHQLHYDSVPAALFEVFRLKLAHNLLLDRLEDERLVAWVLAGSQVLPHQLAQQADHPLWAEMGQPREAILLQTMADTVSWFEANVGGPMSGWTWGRIHTATFTSTPLGQSGIGPIESLVNRGPFPTHGGASIVNANSWSWANPAGVTGHVSMRLIVDLDNLDRTWAVGTTGQSGHPGHPHYDDMIPLWLNGAYYELPYSRAAVEAAAVDRLTLQPAGSN